MAKRKTLLKPYNNGTWTKSRYMQQVRSFLRNAFRYWLPIKDAKLKNRRSNQSGNKRLKWEYQCFHCKQWFMGKDVQVDHSIPCGSIKELWDVPLFIQKLTAESGYELLCKPCHQVVTTEERKAPVTASHWHERIKYYTEAIIHCERELREINNREHAERNLTITDIKELK